MCDGLDNDSDGDGYGRDDSTIASCTMPHGHAVLGGDCDYAVFFGQ